MVCPKGQSPDWEVPRTDLSPTDIIPFFSRYNQFYHSFKYNLAIMENVCKTIIYIHEKVVQDIHRSPSLFDID